MIPLEYKLFIAFHIVFIIFNIYLSYKSKNDKYNATSIALAIFSPYIYLYHMYKKDKNFVMKTVELAKKTIR